ncbi:MULTISPECIES: NADH-quinone oxidoreductase subunit NuoN [unclassified Rhizobacter]|uniref:NADH-quinone oxidoreductase subunit NuoN n=1 Tax=unclassified Rhizobacter TaxID=2640088 RepID=UPI0006FE2D2A|nr:MULTISPECIES: NADH-quinone oxidoreductase subunit NuoN [unclassified Rhizobacter]KQU64589.1 NADH:ubiquinone oxidoreductase subunit N [Rhizobacter sp. Root29]KQW11599.1 NADH:ubiquinone oxidoreductase subunit N [Rhizobacter sp. Root1238]KRB19866.1 NADH:ubiquinone oxidoreductase subunit N [Rhizobacter sp. Root16D2]
MIKDMNWLAVYPELVLLAMACVVAMVDLWVTDPKRTPTYWLTQATLAVVGVMHLLYFDAGFTVYGMQRMMVTDPLGHLLGFFAALAVMVTLVYARPYAESREMLKGELFTLSLFSLLGISVMLAANNFLVIYLGLELMSLSLYALTAMRRDHAQSTEAAMKYFVLGALASGFLLYGLSMMYGATGSLDIPKVFNAIATGQLNPTVLALGLVFIVAGLAFKLGAVPFHMWLPDVYHGAPTAVTLLIAGAPKLAAFAMTFRLLVEGLSGVAGDWQQMMMVLAIASMFLGNLAAIAQSNLKRMLAYSTIAQMGFMLLGFTTTVITGNTLSASNGYSSALFYMVTYVFTTLGTFGVVMLLSRQGFESENIDDLKGLAKRNPWYAGVMAIFMFSLAGIPPTVGFYAKLAVLQALITTNVTFYIVVAVLAVLLSLVGAFYYLRLVKVMYFEDPVDTQPIVAASDVRLVLSLNGAAVLVFGILPGGLMALCSQAILKALST